MKDQSHIKEIHMRFKLDLFNFKFFISHKILTVNFLVKELGIICHSFTKEGRAYTRLCGSFLWNFHGIDLKYISLGTNQILKRFGLGHFLLKRHSFYKNTAKGFMEFSKHFWKNLQLCHLN